jgi:hypothetical protein
MKNFVLSFNTSKFEIDVEIFKNADFKLHFVYIIKTNRLMIMWHTDPLLGNDRETN